MNDRAIERAILLQDLCVMVLSVGLAHLAREALARVLPGLKPEAPGGYLYLLLVFVPTWAWCADRVDLYRVRTLVGPILGSAKAVVWAQTWGAAALGVILTAAQAPLNRSLIVLHLVISTVLLMGVKVAQRRWVRRLRGELVALLLGTPDDLDEAEAFETIRGRRIERLLTHEVQALRLRLQEGSVDEVVLPRALEADQMRRLLEACEEAGLPAFVPVPKVDLERARPRAETLGRQVYLAYDGQEPDRPARLVKAVLDRTLAALALLATLPLMAFIAVAVRITSPGPALFVQPRGGLNGRPFRMLKFRTMSVGAEAERDALLSANEMDGPVFKIRNDPRVTPVGRFLRRTSLDELPQLINVLLGHMSLVGPRPLPVVETVKLTGAHRRRLAVRPGITGLWQVSGRNELGFEQWMNLDLEYADDWSLGLDFAILLRTLPALLSRRGAH